MGSVTGNLFYSSIIFTASNRIGYILTTPPSLSHYHLILVLSKNKNAKGILDGCRTAVSSIQFGVYSSLTPPIMADSCSNNGDYDVTLRINEDDTIQSIMRHAIRYFWTLFGPLPYFTYSYNRNHVVYACR